MLRSILVFWSCFWLLVAGCRAVPPPYDESVDDTGARSDGAARARQALLDVLGAAPPEIELRELVRLDGELLRARFALRVGGLPIDGGDAIVVLRTDGTVRSVNAATNAATSLVPARRIDAAAAEHAALDGRDPDATVEPSTTLVALPKDGAWVAAWRVLVRGEALRREVFVDAVTARVVHERQALYAASEHGSGIGVLGERRMLDVYRGSNGYELRDDTRGERGIRTTSAGGTFAVPGKVVRSHDPQAWDEDVFGAGAAVDAHANGAIVWDYLDRVLGRSSWDGDGGALRLVVHSGEHVANAYWDGRYAVFGDGDGDSMLALPAALDIVAHEIFHGVTGSEAGLIYEGQSGALSESLSDVFGSLVEIDAGDGDWRIGGAIADPPLRDLAQPWRTGAPSHMREYLHLPLTPDGDMGGVHLNSTIPSHAAVLIADGGVHAISHIKVAAVGRDAMRNVWWRAVTVYLTPRATFSEFARATIVSAEDLFGADDPQTASVRQAWRAVGVTQ